jgi:type II secretory pathway pseudopilin PulG
MYKQETKNIKEQFNKEAGLTLVEALFAMAVSVVALVSLAGIFTIAMKTNASSRNFTTATTFAQDKLEQLGTVAFSRLVDPSRMQANPNRQSDNDALIVGSLTEDVRGADGSFYSDIIIVATENDVQPAGTITVVRPDGTAETRKPDGTVINENPFDKDRVTYTRKWVIMSSTEENPADRRLTLAVRVRSENAPNGKTPEQVDLFTVMTHQ